MARYIDAEKLKERMSNYTADAISDTAYYLVDDIQTEDVAPIKHGHWILVDKTFRYSNGSFVESGIKEKCSECRRYVYRYEYPAQYNYCPNCGVKMDGKA